MRYEVLRWNWPDAVSAETSAALAEVHEALSSFVLRSSHVSPDGAARNKSRFAIELQEKFRALGWRTEVRMGSHHIDCVSGKVALEIEWHSTDKSFPRDVLNFDQLWKAGSIEVGVIVTRSETLRAVFRAAGKRDHSSTSHIAKLQSLLAAGWSGCPIAAFSLEA